MVTIESQLTFSFIPSLELPYIAILSDNIVRVFTSVLRNKSIDILKGDLSVVFKVTVFGILRNLVLSLPVNKESYRLIREVKGVASQLCLIKEQSIRRVNKEVNNNPLTEEKYKEMINSISLNDIRVELMRSYNFLLSKGTLAE